MKKILAAICLLAGLSGMAFADTASPNYYFVLPSTGIQGSPNWGTKLNADLVNIDTVIAAGLAIKVTNGATVGTAIGATSATYVLSGGVNFSTITTAINNVINTTNTWTAQQTFQNAVTISSSLSVGNTLNVAGSSFVFSSAGVLTMSQQPGISLRRSAPGLILQGDYVYHNMFWDLRTSSDPWNMIDLTGSSATVTIPVTGTYLVVCSLQSETAQLTDARFTVQILINAAFGPFGEAGFGSGHYPVVSTTPELLSLTAGNTLTCQGRQNIGTNIEVYGPGQVFTVLKVR